jgi:hypothetical protein
MKTGRPTKFTPAIKAKLAQTFFLGFNDAQAAAICGVDERTIRRVRAGGFCPEIKKAELEKEVIYRTKIWNGELGWQGAAWYLERKHATQFSRPEVLMQISNNTLNQVNNTLVITAEVASTISKRRKEVESKVERLFKDRRKRPQIGLRDANGNGEGHDSGQQPETPESPHSDKD